MGLVRKPNDASSGRGRKSEAGRYGANVQLSLQQVPKRAERSPPIGNDLDDRQHGHRQDRSWDTPHPVLKDQGKNDRYRIYGEPVRQQHRRDDLSFEDVDAEV
jgi:hypothetical protein